MARRAPSPTLSFSPTKVTTERWWSESISRSMMQRPGTDWIAVTIRSTTARSRPSLRLGTHSTIVFMVCLENPLSGGAEGISLRGGSFRFGTTLEFGHLGGSPLECAGLTVLCLPAASTQAPTADASKNSQQAFQVRFEDKSLRNVRFKNVANFSVVVWGCRQAAANESAVKPAHSKEVATAGCGYQKCPNSPAP